MPENLFSYTPGADGPTNPVDLSYLNQMYGGMGRPPMPQYQNFQAVNPPIFDSWNAAPGRNMAPPLGALNFQNPLVNMAGSMIMSPMMSAFTGGNNIMNPFFGTNGMSPSDYYQAQLRQQSMMQSTARTSLLAQSSGLISSVAGQDAGRSVLFQTAYDMIAPGGSLSGMAGTIYQNLGSRMGGNYSQQFAQSANLATQINAMATTSQGIYAFDKVGGLNRGELADTLNLAVRQGYMSQSPLASGNLSTAKFTGMAKTIGAAKEILGPDASVGDAFKLIEKLIPDAASMDPAKSRGILEKIKSASSALDIDSKAMAAYVEMMNKVYQSAGMSTRGGVAARAAMQTLSQAESVAAAAADLDVTNPNMRNRNNVAANLASKVQQYANSSVGQSVSAAAQAYASLSSSDRSSFSGQMKALFEAERQGDVGGMNAILSSLTKNSTFSKAYFNAGLYKSEEGIAAGREAFGAEDGIASGPKAQANMAMQAVLRGSGVSDARARQMMNDPNFYRDFIKSGGMVSKELERHFASGTQASNFFQNANKTMLTGGLSREDLQMMFADRTPEGIKSTQQLAEREKEAAAKTRLLNTIAPNFGKGLSGIGNQVMDVFMEAAAKGEGVAGAIQMAKDKGLGNILSGGPAERLMDLAVSMSRNRADLSDEQKKSYDRGRLMLKNAEKMTDEDFYKNYGGGELYSKEDRMAVAKTLKDFGIDSEKQVKDLEVEQRAKLKEALSSQGELGKSIANSLLPDAKTGIEGLINLIQKFFDLIAGGGVQVSVKDNNSGVSAPTQSYPKDSTGSPASMAVPKGAPTFTQ